MNVKEVFSTEDWIFLEAQRELFPRKLMPSKKEKLCRKPAICCR